MRKLLTLLLMAVTVFTVGAKAQLGTTCNAEFNVTLTGNTAHFTPVVAGDSLTTFHAWIFGDGTPSSGLVFPSHTYGAAGVYTVQHMVWRVTPNGAFVCSDTAYRTVTIANTVPVCNLQANFTWARDSIQTNKVYFNNLTVGLQTSDSILWTFGDGTSSTAVNPTHTYAQAGTYNVCLRVKRLVPSGTPPCVSEVCKTVVIPTPCNLQPNFTIIRDSLQTNTFTFINTSVDYQSTDSLYWTFGDGTSSTATNPTHTFTQPGTYAVCLIIRRITAPGATPCVREICKTVTVTAPCNLQAYFTWRVDSLQSNKVYFTNASGGFQPGDSIRWTFGDGTVSYDVNPVHVYNQPGSYTVCLRIKRNTTTAAGTPCVSEICKIVVVTVPCNLQANFTWRADSLQINKIFFTNTSGGFQAGDSIRWTFGDGTSSFDVNPSHVYSQPGTYTVCLRIKRNSTTATGAPCVSEICKTVVVTIPCNLQPNFNVIRDSLQANTFYFVNTSVNYQSGDSLYWTFGDGTSSTAVNPVHTYTSPGNYTVCLRIKRITAASTTPCVREICKTVAVVAPCNLQANFTWRADSLQNNKIYFTNTSGGFQAGDSIRWTFGDGTSSYDVNPVHIYTQPGTYTVCLRIKRNGISNTAAPCVSEICKVIVVQAQVQPCNLQANFTWRVDSLQNNRIFFTNTSGGFQAGDSIRWTFGDGTSSYDVNPAHVYTQPGTYTVCLRIKRNSTTATGAPCVSEICKVIVIQPQVQPCNLQAYFTWRVDSLQTNTFYFTNATVNYQPGDSLYWTFGDGTSSTAVNPVHTFTTPGTYNVCLKVRRPTPAGTAPCVAEICKTVVVAPTCNITANFTWRPDSLNSKKIYFTNLGTSATGTATWSFGDGTSATSWNAVHEYAQPGTYLVCLRVQLSPNCIATKCDTITVTTSTPPCSGLANFNATRSATNSQEYAFTPVYQNPAYLYIWSFGDGTGSQSMVANHTYQQSGTYTVCLTVFRNNTCVTTSCKVITVVSQLNCNNINVNFVYQQDAFLPNKLYFYAISNFPLLQQRWTITKLPATATSPTITLYQNNPVYVFTDTGWYRVCLRTVTMGGCVKEICQTIHITQVAAQQCQLYAYPNPAQSSINVNVVLPQAQTIYAYVYNAQNILVRQKVQAGITGNNIVNINIADLVAGTYTIRIVYGNKTCYARFQKI